MKRSLFFTLLFACSVLSAQTVTNADANQVGKNIEITYDLDRKADISVDYSTDGGRTYTTLRHVSGDVGMSVRPGHKTITWDVLSEVDKFVGDNICFRVNATTDANGHEWVDLGLSVKWATCNVGATKPEEYGNHYAWGETTTKREYISSTYKWCNGSHTTLTKYNTESDYGTVDNKTVLELADDAARANWGGKWRMPTDEEWKELHNNCAWTWTTRNGVKGYAVKSKINGNSIFLPAAGCRVAVLKVGIGHYWSSSLYTGNSDNAWQMCFDSGIVGMYRLNSGNSRGSYRYCGRSVRPVL